MMSTPTTPAKPSKTDRRRTTTKPRSKRTRKSTPAPGAFEVTDDWNHRDISGWLAPSKPPADPALLKSWEQQGRVDRLRDLIPFWRDGVMAAEKGEEAAKLEHFLQRMEDEEQSATWQSKNNGWGKDTGEDVWGRATRGGGWDTPPQAGSGDENPWSPDDEPVGLGSPGVDDWGAEQDVAGWGEPAELPAAARRNKGIAAPSEDTSRSAAGVWSGRKKKAARTPGDSWTFVEEVARQEDASHERKRSMHEFYAMPTQEKVKKIQEVVEYLRILDHVSL